MAVAPPERMVRLKELLGDDVVVEPIHGNDHPVLDRAVGVGKKGPIPPEPEAGKALTESIRVLRRGLLGES